MQRVAAPSSGGSTGHDAARLLEVVRTDPVAAEVAARERLTVELADPSERARLHWVIGLARREAGTLDDASAAFRTGAELARSVGDQHLWAQIAASLALLLGQLGDLDAAADAPA